MNGLLTKASYSSEANLREKNNLKIAYNAACESIVLLENDGSLPLHTKKVALYGAGASHTIKGGTGSGEVNERHSVTVLEGMQNAGFEISTMTWIHDFQKAYDEGELAFRKGKLKSTIKNPMSFMADYPGIDGRLITDEDIKESNTDCCIYVLSRQAGEGVDRRAEKGDYFVTDTEKANIQKCAKSYPHFILIINGGSQIDMSFVDEISGINALIFMCQLGTEGGNAVADILLGNATPSGKLTDTWAKTYSDIPFANEFSYLNGNLKDEYYKEGIYVGYRYFDSFDVAPRYPFGYGLSYTSFEIEPITTTVEGTKITVNVTVENIGETYSGKEVVQVYLSAPSLVLAKEYQSLVAFGKTSNLAPGEKQLLELTFDLSNCGSYNEADASYILEAGKYIVRVGNSSRNSVPCGKLVLEEKVVLSKHKNICPLSAPIEELKAKSFNIEETDLDAIVLDSNAFVTKTFDYNVPAICNDSKVRAFMDGLSFEDMVEIVVGIGMFGGETRFTMPGSVGNTTSKFWDKDLVNVTLCDGPAGIRIQKRTALLKNGKLKAIDPVFSMINALPGFVKKAMLADEDKETVLYQFTTAFPVACALAQTWNTDLLYEVGLAIHEEMKEYGCTYWLAPALNIHRNPLCGRNFEYFSEDPFLSGKVTSAITKGVQSEEGYYVTIKHYACNNQEDNRKAVSSNLSERALREIYLRGFQIAVEEGGAKGLMTSYNKINGVYTPNSYDLCTTALRNEWGFKGVVMTDWFSTSKGSGDTAACMAAGNDLIMPGGNSFKKEILKGLKTGTVSEEDLRRCCANVVHAILNSNLQKEYMEGLS